MWTRQTLDDYLTDPERALPGSEMSMPGLTSAEDRRDVIEYIESAGR